MWAAHRSTNENSDIFATITYPKTYIKKRLGLHMIIFWHITSEKWCICLFIFLIMIINIMVIYYQYIFMLLKIIINIFILWSKPSECASWKCIMAASQRADRTQPSQKTRFCIVQGGLTYSEGMLKYYAYLWVKWYAYNILIKCLT